MKAHNIGLRNEQKCKKCPYKMTCSIVVSKHSSKASAAESTTGESLYSDTYVICVDQCKLTGLFVCRHSTLVQDNRPCRLIEMSAGSSLRGKPGSVLKLEVDVGLTADIAWSTANDQSINQLISSFYSGLSNVSYC